MDTKKDDQKFDELLASVREFGGRLDRIENRLKELDKGLKTSELKKDLMAEETKAYIQSMQQEMEDGFARYDETMRFIKNNIHEHLNPGYSVSPHTRQTMIPRSISTYITRQVPSRPWYPDK